MTIAQSEPDRLEIALDALALIKQEERSKKENDPYPMALSYVIGTFNRAGYFNSSILLLQKMQEYLDEEDWQENSQLPKSFFQNMVWLLYAELEIALGDYEEAIKFLNKMDMDEARKDFIHYNPNLEDSYFNFLADLAIVLTGQVLKNSGNLEKAKITFNKFFGEIETTYTQGNLNFHSIVNLSEIHFKLGDKFKYSQELSRAINAIRKEERYESWLKLVELYLLDNNFEQAHFYLEKIAPGYEENLEASEVKKFQFKFNTQYGLYYAAINEHKKAIAYFNKNFNVNSNYYSNAIIYTIKNYINLTKSFIAVQAFKEAEASLMSALNLIEGKSILDPINHKFLGAQKFELLEIFALYSNLEIAKNNNIISAIHFNEKAIELIGIERNNVFLEKDRQLLIEAAYPIFEQGIELLYQSEYKDKHARILELMEQSKALNLIDELVQADKFSQIDVDEELLKNHKKINGYINYTKAKLDEFNIDISQLKSLSRTLDSLQNEKEIFEGKIYASSDASKTSNKKRISLNQLQKKLIDRESCFIEFFQGKEYLYSLSVTKHKSNLSRLKITDKLLNDIEAFYSSIAEGNNQFRALTYLLYQNLLEPHEHLLKRQILIVPDGKLNVLPFDALCTEEVEKQTRLKDYPFIIKSSNVSLINSALFLSMVKQNKIEIKNKNVLAIHPDYSNNEDFQPLGFSQQEINFLDDEFNARVLSSTYATKNQLDRIIENYSMIHFSSHAVADLEKGRNSYIALDNAKAHIDDSCRLKAHEIRNYKLNADLVVLSACETGIGSFEKGEGVMSLGRSFIQAGAQGVLSSLWSVSDKSTALLTTEFYRLIHAGSNKPEAIGISKRKLMKDANFAHPYFWAGFYYTGDIKTKSNFNLNWIWIGIPLLMIFIFFIYKFKSDNV